MKPKDVLNKVKCDYTAIAKEFDATRNKPWPEFTHFLKYMKKSRSGDRINLLDIGCGNGRLYDFLKNEPINYIGIDNNKKFLKIATNRYPKTKFKYADVTKLPFSAKSFDSIWCIAVLHHLPTKTLRLSACEEMKRTLKKSGSLMITVWNLWQAKYKKYINKKTHDSLIPWGQDKKVKRYYHAFTKAELKQLLKKSGFNNIKEVKSTHNIALIAIII